MQKYPRGSRGSPAKGVVWENRSEGSNPSFCARMPVADSRYGRCVFEEWAQIAYSFFIICLKIADYNRGGI